MLCENCRYDWPDEVNRCPFCGRKLQSEPLAADTEVIAMDLALVGLKSLLPYVSLAKGLPSKAKAAAGVVKTITRRLLGRNAWTAVYTSDRISIAAIPHDLAPARVKEALAGHVAALESLGFVRLGDGIVPQRLSPPYVSIFSNPAVPCIGQISSSRPGLPGGVSCVLFETRFSDGTVLVTSNTPTLRHALGPWTDFCYLPRHSTQQLFEVHRARLEAIGEAHGACGGLSSFEEFTVSAVSELRHWFEWALSTGICVRLRSADCYR